MPDPLVCCVMLTRDRPEMARRAVECFDAQTYERRSLIILDTGERPANISGAAVCYMPKLARSSIGTLRNEANTLGSSADVLIHWDDDDWSHPHRIAEQVELLQSSGADAVGYSSMLFYETQQASAWHYAHLKRASYLIGTSLCYWRKTWERKPFPDLMRGEDTAWQRDLNTCAVSSLGVVEPVCDPSPRMIASIHGGNTSKQDPEAFIRGGSHEWRRAEDWDEHCREKMRLGVRA